jgi:hypothetical protein
MPANFRRANPDAMCRPLRNRSAQQDATEAERHALFLVLDHPGRQHMR